MSMSKLSTFFTYFLFVLSFFLILTSFNLVTVTMLKVKQFLYSPGQALEGSRSLRLPDFHCKYRKSFYTWLQDSSGRRISPSQRPMSDNTQ